ncbi:MAG: hypothetical protein ACI30K_02730, partial [Muribaculaceae bacterium]
MYKASDMSQSALASLFNQMYDLAQGKKAATIFEEADTTEYPLAEVIKQVLNIDYEPAKNGNNNVANGGADVALRNQVGQGGKPRSNEPPASGEQTPAGTEPTDSGAGAPDDSGGGGNDSERTDNLSKKVEISSAERTEMASRIVDWLSDDNLSKAFGKTRGEIFEEFGNELMPIAYIPTQFMSLVNPALKDARIYCGKGYFIDHALRNHGATGTQVSIDDVDVSKYLNIQTVLDSPDAVKETTVDGKRTVIFIKKIGRFFAELTQVEEDGKIVLHKSLFNQKKEPYAKLNDIRQKDTSSEGGTSSISHAVNPAPAISLKSRGDVISDSKLQTAASQPHGLVSDGKGNTLSGEKQEDVTKSAENEQGNEAQSDKDSTAESTAAEQSAETQPTALQPSNAVGSLAEAYIRAQNEYDSILNDYIEGRIDQETHDSVSSELWQKRNAALSALEEALLTLDDNELIAVGAADKRLNGIVELMLQDRKNSNALVTACEALLESQGAIVGKPNTRYKLADIIDKKSNLPQLLGVYHDGGYAVATDTHVLVADKREYDAANDGKIIGLDGVEIDGKYLPWQVVMPKQVRAIGLDVKDMLGFIAGVKAKAKSLTPKRKPSDICVLVNIGGNICTYRIDQLERFCKAAASLDAKLYIARRGGANNPLYAEGENGYAMIMPMGQPGEPPRNESGHYIYDKAVSIGEKEASVWSDNANAVERKKLTDAIGAQIAENEAQESQPGAGDVDMLRRKWEAMK